jgi:hypothetical protein
MLDFQRRKDNYVEKEIILSQNQNPIDKSCIFSK